MLKHNTKQQILALLANAQQLIEEGEWHCDGIKNGDSGLDDCKSEMLRKVADAEETVGDYLDD